MLLKIVQNSAVIQLYKTSRALSFLEAIADWLLDRNSTRILFDLVIEKTIQPSSAFLPFYCDLYRLLYLL